MKGIEVPELTEDFTADPVELFFDLAYVFAFSQVVARLIEDPTWAGAGRTLLVFLLMWLPWSQFTWAANAVSGNGRTVRVIFLVATAASVPMAASVSTAFERGGPVFAVATGVIMLMGVATLGLSLERGSEVQQSVIRWMWPNFLAMAVLVGGAFVDGSGRVVLWSLVVLIVIGAMAAAGRGQWIIRPGHFAERHGLIVIVALGEVIVALGLPVVQGLEAGEGLPAATVIALVASGAFAGSLWWGYFDRPGPALEYRALSIEAADLGRYVRDVYTGAHAAIVAGILLVAAALEEIALHPGDDVDLKFRFMLFGGLALSGGGVAIAVWRAFHVVARERLVAAAVIGLTLALAGSWNGTVVIVVVELIVIATLVVEHRRVER